MAMCVGFYLDKYCKNLHKAIHSITFKGHILFMYGKYLREYQNKYIYAN